jgi:hypothetical protein
MKKINFFLIAAIAVTLSVAACNSSNPSGESSKGSTSRDSTGVLPPPSDNSSATNPSLADTAYSKKDTSNMKKDTSMKH